MKRSLTVGMLVCAWLWCAHGVLGQGGGAVLAPPQILFVKDGVVGGTGTQKDPFGSLDAALAAANDAVPTTIYIAEGVYVPTQPYGPNPQDPEARTFLLENWVALVGGWDGEATPFPPKINSVEHPVDLSGNQGSVLSWHIVTVPDTAVGVQRLEGVTVRESYAGATLSGRGGGLLVIESVVDVVDCTFRNNGAKFIGAAIYNAGGEVYIYYSRFENNVADRSGGAIGNGDPAIPIAHGGLVEVWNSEFLLNRGDLVGGGAIYTGETAAFWLDPNRTRVFNSEFRGNSAWIFGGAVYVGGSPMGEGAPAQTLIYTSRFINNFAQLGGGAVYTQEAVESDKLPPLDVSIVNSAFCSNQTLQWGGAIYIPGPGEATAPIGMIINIINCSFTHNETAIGGGAIFTGAWFVGIGNSILWGNKPDQIFVDPWGFAPTVQFSNVQMAQGLVWPGTGNLNIDPLFDPASPMTDCWVGILASSPMRDMGQEALVPFDTFDIDGDNNTTERLPDLKLNDRVVGQNVDIGARELP